MPLKVAVQMDHIAGVKIAGDSTFAILLEAQRRGHALFHYTPDKLSMLQSRILAPLEPLTVQDVEGAHFRLGPAERTDLAGMDVILMRQDPPFDLAYITASHMLERLAPGVLVVNDPVAVRNAPEKLFVTHFPELMPPTLITRDAAEIARFRAEHGDIVVKPLHGHGGAAVFRLTPDDGNYGSLIDFFHATFKEQFVVQRFLPAVKHGDKRIILIDGAFAGAVNRVPAAGDIRSNMVRGGAAAETDLTDREREICETVGPELSRQGLLFAGLDVIDGYLTEINVTSPTGIRAVAKLGGPDIAAILWDRIEAKRTR
jgi:glutathione synthase